MTTDWFPESQFDLGPDGESVARTVNASVLLNSGGLSVLFVYPTHLNNSDRAVALREMESRLVATLREQSTLARLVRYPTDPTPRVAASEWAKEVAGVRSSNRGSASVAWVDLTGSDVATRAAVLVSLNVQRDFLTEKGPLTLVVVMADADDRRFCPDLSSIASHSGPFHSEPTPKRAMTGSVGFLHISDLHISGSKGWDADVVRANFIHDLPSLLNHANVVPHLVFASGDMTDRGDTRGFLRASDFLQRVMEICAEHVPEADRLLPDGTLGHDLRDWHMPRLFIVPGNHDAVRAGVKRTHRALQTTLWSKLSNPAEYRKELGEWWDEDGTFAEMGDARLRDFYEFTRLVLGDARQTPSGRGHRTDVVTIRGLRIGILQLNSAWMCSDDDNKYKCVPIGERQVRDALEDLRLCGGADFTAGMIHHPPGWWPEAERRVIDGLLRETCDLMMHGHVHDQEWVHTSGPNGELVVLTAGALYESATRTHAFQLGVLDPVNKNLRVHAMTYSSRGRGHWHVDAGISPGNATGVFEFPLKRVVQSGADANAQGANPVAIADRLARIAAQVHGAVDFVGFPTEIGRPPQARIETLFVPQRYSIWRAGTMTFDELLAEILGRGDASLRQVVPTPRFRARLLDSDTLTSKGASEGPRLPGSVHRQASAFVILGEPGSGKSLTTRALAYFAARSEPSKVPILVPLRNWMASGSDMGLLEFAARELGMQLSETVAVETLLNLCVAGKTILLIDGFDEVAVPERRTFVRNAVVALATSYPKMPIVCTSRALGYRDAPLPGDFTELSLQPFDDEELDSFARRWFENQFPTDPREAEHRRVRFMAALRAEPRAQELARNPLLSTLIAMVHLGEAELPSERAKLYELLVRLMLVSWPKSSRRLFSGEHLLDAARQRRLLEHIAFEMQLVSEPLPIADVSIGLDRDILISRSNLSRIVSLRLVELLSINPLQAETLTHEWIRFVESSLGLLVERSPGLYGFLHLGVLEYLAGCEARRRWSVEGESALAGIMLGFCAQVQFQEMLLLMLGSELTPEGVAEMVVLNAESPEFSLRALRDDVLVSRSGVKAVVENAFQQCARDGGISALALTLSSVMDDIARFSKRHALAVRETISALFLTEDGLRLANLYLLAGHTFRAEAQRRSDWTSTVEAPGVDMMGRFWDLFDQSASKGGPQFAALWMSACSPKGALRAAIGGDFADVLGSIGRADSSPSVLFESSTYRVASDWQMKRKTTFGFFHTLMGYVEPAAFHEDIDQFYLTTISDGVASALYEWEPAWQSSTSAAGEPCLPAVYQLFSDAKLLTVLRPMLSEIMCDRLDAPAPGTRESAGADILDSPLQIAKLVASQVLTQFELTSERTLASALEGPAGFSFRNEVVALEALSPRRYETNEEARAYLYGTVVPVVAPLMRAMCSQLYLAALGATAEGNIDLVEFNLQVGSRLTAAWAYFGLDSLAHIVLKCDTPAARAKIAAYAVMSRSILGEWPIDTEWLDAWRAAGEPDDWSERYVWRLCNAFDDPENVALADAARQVLAETIAAHLDKHERDVAEWLQNMDLHPMTAAEREAEARAAEIRWFEDVEKYGDAGWGNIVQRHYTRAAVEAEPPSEPLPKAKRSRKKNVN